MPHYGYSFCLQYDDIFALAILYPRSISAPPLTAFGRIRVGTSFARPNLYNYALFQRNLALEQPVGDEEEARRQRQHHKRAAHVIHRR